jgi:hypothetical protein
MRVLVVGLVAAAALSVSPARACGVDPSPFGSGTYRKPTPVFVFAAGGVGTQRPTDTDARTMTPLVVAGLGGDVYAIGGVHFAPMIDVMMRSRVSAVTTTDLAFAARVSSEGFALGGFGVAIDGGVWTRVYGGRAIGPVGAVTLGAPAGLQASWLVRPDSLAFIVGIDVARMK